jgi:hypothetical protein
VKSPKILLLGAGTGTGTGRGRVEVPNPQQNDTVRSSFASTDINQSMVRLKFSTSFFFSLPLFSFSHFGFQSFFSPTKHSLGFGFPLSPLTSDRFA